MTTTEGLAVNEFQKKLGLMDVISQSLSVIAPAMSGAFLTYLAATKAGGATAVSYLLGAIAMLFVGLVVAMFARTLSSSGSMYTYLSKGASRTVGFLGGWAYVAAYLLFGSGVLAGFGFFMSLFFNIISPDLQIEWYWFTLLGVVIVAALNFFNVAVSTRNQLIFLVLSMSVMIVVAIIVIAIGSPAESLADGSPLANAGTHFDPAVFWPGSANVEWNGIFFGMSFAMLSFVGSESAASLSEETKDAKRNIPRAIIGSVIIAGVFYVLICYATAIGFGGAAEATKAWPLSASGLAAVAPGQLSQALVTLAAAGASLFCALGLHTASSRVLFAMGREKVLPQALGRLNPKYNTPWNSMFVAIVVWLLLIFVPVIFTSQATQIAVGGGDPASAPYDFVSGGLFSFTLLLGYGTPVVIFVYLMLGVTAVIHGVRTKKTRFVLGGIMAAIFAGVAIFGGVYPSFTEGVLPAIAIVPWVGIAILAVGLILAIWTRASRPKAWAEMGAVFDEL